MGNRGRGDHRAAHFASRALLALASLTALLLAGCGSGAGGQATLDKNQIFSWPYVNADAVSNSTLDEAVLDPAVITNAIDLSNIDMLYSGLVTLNSSTLQVEPDAASSWTISPNGMRYIFNLRPDLAFSDGTPITATDFAYSINRAIGSTDQTTGRDMVCDIEDAQSYGQTGNCLALGYYYLGLIQGVTQKLALTPTQALSDSLYGPPGSGKGIIVIDAHTLEINITQPAAYFLEALDYPSSYPVEESLVEKHPGGTWVNYLDQGAGSSGPFMVKSYTPGKDLQFEPNRYWERAHGKTLTLKEVDRPFLSSQDTEYTNYDKSGHYDYTDVTGEEYTFAVGQSDFHEVASLTTDYIGLNFDAPPFDNPQVRQAFDLALNKQLLIDRVYNGEYIPTNHIVPEGNPGYNAQLTGPDGTQSITGNQNDAKSLLQKAIATCNAPTTTVDGVLAPPPDYCPYIDSGASSQTVYLTAGVNDDATEDEVATIIMDTWNQVLGLKVKIDAYNGLSDMENALFAPGGNKQQAWLIGWLADYPDPQDWLSLQFCGDKCLGGVAPNNISYVNDPNLDALMNQADTDQNMTERMNQYHTIEQEVVNLCAWIPLDQEKTSWRLRPWVQGFGLNQLLTMEDVDWPNVYIQAH